MDVRDFLTLAETLVAGPTEAMWRSAVSRAYYAAFHVARQLLTQCRFKVPRGDRAHAYLWQRLHNSGHPDVARAGAELDTLRSERNRADYDCHLSFDQISATAQVQIARQIIQTLEAAAQEPVKTQITDAMKIYERDVLQNVTWGP
jgi:uncharacterized protein (UPF0332 family)